MAIEQMPGLDSLRQTIQTVLELRALPAGWNSYRAPPIGCDAILTAIELLTRTIPPDAPLPHVVPTSLGGVQFDWRSPSLEVEVRVQPDRAILLAYEDLRTGDEWEGEITQHPERLVEILGSLAHHH